MAVNSVGWGIVGTGEIARRFASDLPLASGAVLHAVHSRTPDNAERFRAETGAQKAYHDLDSFMSDPYVQAVYVATPNSLHLAQTLRALRNRKAVLTEKPIAPSFPEADVIQREAMRQKTFAMEAMWTRFLPAVQAAKARIKAGAIGEIRRITADLSYYRPYDPESRFFSRALGGGAALDLGVYPVSLAMYFLGEPEKVSGRWFSAKNGVDMRTEMTLHYASAEAELSCGFDRDGANHFLIEGSAGAIRLDAPFLKVQRLTLYSPAAMKSSLIAPSPQGDRLPAKLLSRLPTPLSRLWGCRIEHHPFEGNGLQFQAMAVMNALRAGETRSPIMPLQESVAVLRAIGIVLSRSPMPEAEPAA
ncbi:gfo/Idh/MocA family oxidoreductase [Phyllobacterium salinisoli]|uniref:Gfo/Idh/MocA family oxidoreductase n=1 Tax=Phyllobacterium salinisoli TaxID=1899321 RepID=A0A368KAT8_9HYPH|nr:Gfo/Idh/MocA family oxidoreductase [Phyllobacterium salinisoli]RCS25705.1 gfo/Idh/MocA family oxidoreductase [Phyllobacterium salinisoli]